MGLTREGHGVAARVLLQHQLDPDSIRAFVAKMIGLGSPDGSPSQGLTPRCCHIIELATEEAVRTGRRVVDTEHLLLGLLREEDCMAVRIVSAAGIPPAKLYADVMLSLGGSLPPPKPAPKPREPIESPPPSRDSRLLEQFSRDLTRMADEGRLDPVAGRERELRRAIQILTRRTKNNPVLIGEPGVGKTAVAEGLACRISAGDVPEPLQGKRLLALDLSAMVAGTKYRGEFEERVKRLLAEVRRASNIILFLDELHTLVGAGSAEGAIDAANILKPVLGRGELQVVGATTLTEYRQHIEKDAALERRFQPVTIDEPTAEEAVSILTALRPRYEAHHRLSITSEAIQAAVDLAQRYLPARFLPDKAIDLMDEAAARVRMEPAAKPQSLLSLEERHRAALADLREAVRQQDFEQAALLRDAEDSFCRQLEAARLAWHSGFVGSRGVTPEDVAEVVSDWTGIPVTAITKSEAERLLGLEEELHNRVVGQSTAVAAVARAIRRSRSGLKDPRRPVGSFLFPGPSGVGKTELCKTLAQALFGSEDALIRFDMSEYREAHTVSRLVGSPPGYVGHDEGGQLTEQVRRRPYSVVLFDELEKAHEEVWNLLLQILEDGILTDAQGRRIDFRNAVVVMTTNAGTRRQGMPSQPVGFSSGQSHQDLRDRMVLAELRRVFRPEFLNRIDDIVVFHPLSPEETAQVAGHMADQIAARMASLGVSLRMEPDALALIARQATDPDCGARPMRRYLASQLEDSAAELLLNGSLTSGSALSVSAGPDGLALTVLAPTKSELV